MLCTRHPQLYNFGVFEAEPDVCFYFSDQVEIADNKLDGSDEFLIRGFPCHAPNNIDFDSTNSSFSPLNDVFYFSHITHQAFMFYLGVPPISDYITRTSLKIRAKVHVGTKLENAFWDREYVNFGDGNRRFYPLTSLDVVAHEIGHAFTDGAARFHYRGMSAGIDESFSDVTAVAVRHYYRTEVNPNAVYRDDEFLIGNEITKTHPGYIRDLRDPRARSGLDNASQYNSLYSRLPHLSSGVFNRAFYLLTLQPGWDIPTAFRLYATANMVYWESTTTFHCATCGLIFAAIDLEYPTDEVVYCLGEVGARCEQC